VYDEEGRVCVESSALGVFVQYDTGALLRVPKDIMDSMPRYERHLMEYRPRKIRLPKDLKPELVDEYGVREYHIDGNKHMNNAWYVAIGEEYLPRDWAFSHIRIEYLLPAVYGDVMRVERYAIENGYIVVMRRKDGKIYSIIEFI
jgi:acyl-ACP thioesterase